MSTQEKESYGLSPSLLAGHALIVNVEEGLIHMPYSKHAFNCAKCPGRGGDAGCPAWWETAHENTQTGEIKTVRGCGWEQLPLYLIEVIKASNRPAASIDATRNEIADGFSGLIGAVTAKRPLPKN